MNFKWSRSFLMCYAELEKYLSKDTEGLSLLKRFGNLAEDSNMWGSAKLTISFSKIEKHLVNDINAKDLLNKLTLAFDEMFDHL
jgi:hypothetical protein